jgi:NTE family protein
MGSVVGDFMPRDIPHHRLIRYSATNFDELINDFQGLPKTLKKMMNCMRWCCHSIILKWNTGSTFKGMYNFNLLSRITRHVRHVRVNKLPIPFMYRY